MVISPNDHRLPMQKRPSQPICPEHIIVSPSVTDLHAQLLLERRDEVLLVRKSLPFPSELKVFLERVEEGSRKHFSTLAPTMRQVPEHESVILNLEGRPSMQGSRLLR